MMFKIIFVLEIKTDNRISIARNIPESMSFIEGICKFLISIFKYSC